MSLPVSKILWAATNNADIARAHLDHLHVEGPHVSGSVPKDCTSKWTAAIVEIVEALNTRFGNGGHNQVWDNSFGWTHMGVYNCRNIGGTSTPSQHAFSNAIDIGPYYGVEQQQKFYDFLTGKDQSMLTANEEAFVKDLFARMAELYPDQDVPTASGISTYLVPDVRKGIITADELQKAIAEVPTGTVDKVARAAAAAANAKLKAIKEAI